MSFEDATALADADQRNPENPPSDADASGMVWSAPSANGSAPVAVDPASLAVVERVTRLATSDLAVLFTGDEGVGKRTFAAFLHARSKVGRGPFVRVSCQPTTLAQLEAALFGIEPGPGVPGARAGALERADGGTLLIEHLNALPASFEARLIHVLEFAQVYRVGSVAPRRARVRFLATAPRRPEGRDLVRRLAGAVVEVPPLRARPADIEPLARRFVTETVVGRVEPMTFAPEALGALMAYDWPGNGRELRLAVERAVVSANEGCILARDLDLPARAGTRGGALHDDVERLERQRIEGALAASGGNRSRAARALGIARNTLLARLKAYGMS